MSLLPWNGMFSTTIGVTEEMVVVMVAVTAIVAEMDTAVDEMTVLVEDGTMVKTHMMTDGVATMTDPVVTMTGGDSATGMVMDEIVTGVDGTAIVAVIVE